MRFPKFTAPLVAMLISVQAGCAATSQPKELPPEAIPDRYVSLSDFSTRPASARWWDALGDPHLSALIAQASKANLDVAAASARITAARAHMNVARAQFSPSVSAYGASTRERISRNGLLGSAAGVALPETYTQSDVGLDASWEIDIFGANRANKREALARHAAAVADLEAVRLSIAAEVARVYIEHVVLSQQLASAHREVSLTQEGVALMSQQYGVGQEAESALILARVELQNSQSAIPQLEAEVQARTHAMAALLGAAEPVDLPAASPILGTALEPVLTQIRLDVGLPSDLLLRRPDVRRAEAELEAALARHDFAVADQYPRFTLVSGLGLESIRSGSLIESASKVWHLGPQLTLPLFDGGARRAVVKREQAGLDASIAEYRNTVIGALADVEQALIRYQGSSRAMTTALTRLSESDRLLHLMEASYSQGQNALGETLEARRLRETQLVSALEAKRRVLLGYVALHKALGGGFGGA
jgi:NodT family efflux transporter outer membrane factor (OMF) lipoprotein